MVLKEGQGRAATVYGKTLVQYKEASKKALLPEMTTFSTDFISSQVGKILYGKSVQLLDNHDQEKIVPKTLIETVQLSNLKITPETVSFQPKWHYSELFESADISDKKITSTTVEVPILGTSTPSPPERLEPQEPTGLLKYPMKTAKKANEKDYG